MIISEVVALTNISRCSSPFPPPTTENKQQQSHNNNNFSSDSNDITMIF